MTVWTVHRVTSAARLVSLTTQLTLAQLVITVLKELHIRLSAHQALTVVPQEEVHTLTAINA